MAKTKFLNAVLIVSLIFTLVTTPLFSDVYADSTTSNLSEEEIIESITIEPEDGADFDGYIVSVKDNRVDNINEDDAREYNEIQSADDLFVVDEPEDVLEFADSKDIEYIEPNYAVVQNAIEEGVPNDLSYDPYQKTPYTRIQIPEAWKRLIRGDGVNVAVLDSGLYDNSDLGEIALKLDVTKTPYSTSVSGYPSHGTGVTGVIKAMADNEYAIAGAADKCNLYHYKVYNDDGGGTVSSFIDAMYHIYENYDMDIINISSSHKGKVLAEEEIIDKLSERGTIFTASTGNHGVSNKDYEINEIIYPANYDNVLGIGSVNYSSGNIASSSAKNESVFCVAAGENIRTLTYLESETGVRTASGTSFSSPLVAACLALIKEVSPEITVNEVKELIRKTATDKGTEGYDTSYGYGEINVEAMIQEMLGKYKITFDLDGGNLYDTDSNYMGYTGPLESDLELPIAVKNGYVFDGWYTDKNFSGSPVEKIEAGEKEDKKFYAKWVENDFSHTVTLDANGGVFDGESTFAMNWDDEWDLPVPTKSGSVFDGWYSVSDNFLDKYKIENGSVSNIAWDMTLYAKWKGEKYSLTTELSGGSLAIANPDTIYNNDVWDLGTPTKAGFEFAGWFLDSDFTEQVKSGELINITGDCTVYAKWEEGSYLINLSVNGHGALTGSNQYKVTYNDYWDLEVPMAEGYIHRYWFTPQYVENAEKTGSYYKIDQGSQIKITESTSLYSSWQELNVRINLNLNGGSLVGSGNSYITQGYNTAWNIPDVIKNGYCLEGWYSDPSLTKKIDLTKNMLYETTTDIYANWVKYDISVSVDLNDGEYVSSSEGAVLARGYNMPWAIPDVRKPGYVFEGWFLEEDFITEVDTTSVINILDEDINLYAKWTKLDISVTLITNGGIFTSHSGITLDRGYDTEWDLPEITRAGFTFDGWYLEDTFKTKVDLDSTILIKKGQISLFARWISNIVEPEPVDNDPVYDIGGTNVPVPPQIVAGEIETTSIKSAAKIIYLKKGQSVKLPIEHYTADGREDKLTYSSSKEKVATVSSSGKVKAKNPGTTTITVRASNGKTVKVKINVVKKAKKNKKLAVKVAKTIRVKQSKFITVIYTKGATNVVPTFKSSNKKVFVVDKAGKITGVRKGTAKLTVKIGSKKKVVKIKIK